MNISFLPGCAYRYAEKQAQVRELLPHVAGHFVDQRAFSVNDFVVGKRQHKIFREGVQHGKRHPAVMIFPVDRDFHGK